MYLSAETTAWFHLVRVLIVGVKNFAYPGWPGKSRLKLRKSVVQLTTSSFLSTRLVFRNLLAVLNAGRQNVVHSADSGALRDRRQLYFG
jgi:hypothetical protein